MMVWCMLSTIFVAYILYVDINECNNNICEHKCVNYIGHFKCKCNKGYSLMEDGRSCEGKHPL